MLKKKGHVSIGNLTIYSRDTAMHGAINLYTKKYGYICLRLPYKKIPFYLYFSPNGTPWAATFYIGRKSDREEWVKSRIRYSCFGHNFSVHGWNEEYECENYEILRGINRSVDWTKYSYWKYQKDHPEN